MDMIRGAKTALKMSVDFCLDTPLLLRSGKTGDIADSSIERTFNDNELYINGYVWAGLLRRSLARLTDAGELAAEIGSYHRQNEKQRNDKGVSPLWCEPSVAELADTAINPGVGIDRQWGAAKNSALYNDELVIAGHTATLRFNLFAPDSDKANAWKKNILQALRLVDEGIENIGGGWTYGFGRLKVKKVSSALLDLTSASGRKGLWQWEDIPWEPDHLPADLPKTAAPISVFDVEAKVAAGQLLSIKTEVFPLNSDEFGKLPDSFVFRRNRLIGGKLVHEPVIPGKAIRQALLSVPLERRWRSLGGEKAACESTMHGKQRPKEQRCTCRRCAWFGSTDAAGIIAVTDAPVKNARTQVVSRVQLCEHSMQNMNLFAGEFLTAGEFTFRILIDHSRAEDGGNELVGEIRNLLEEMRGISAPPGWYRLGGTATCTGQVQVMNYSDPGRAD